MSSTREIAVVILAAGQGTRMKSALPKVLHAIGGRPMIAHLAAAVAALRPARTILVAAPNTADAIGEAVSGAAVAIQDPPLGTGHAVMAARKALEGFKGDVLVLFADNPLISTDTLTRMAQARVAADDPAVVVLGFRPDDPAEYGRLIQDGDGYLERIVEFRDAGPAERAVSLCNSGVMAIDGAALPGLLDRLGNDNAKGEYYLTDVVELARRDNRRVAVVEGDAEELLGVNSRRQLAEAEAAAQRRLREAAMDAGATLIDPSTVYFSHDTKLGRDVVVQPNVWFGPGVTVGNNVEIRAFSHLEGCTVGDGAQVGPYARLRPGTVLQQDVRVGNFVEVKAATLESGAKANHLSYIGDARVGAKANIGAGTITCNYDGFLKSHTDIGAGAFIGSNTALVAPVKIGDGAIVGAGSTITDDVSADALALTRAEQREITGYAPKYRAAKTAAKTKAKKS
jgi:bifunctional UDP-N-acetylglucosamine pyrophosphorylase/glucosamine-1-phosphate N-acetyltransferase